MKNNRVRLTESQLHRVIKESVKRVLREVWTSQTEGNIDEIFQEIITHFNKKDILRNLSEYGGENGSPYEFFTDYLRDYYNISLKDCDLICKKLKEYYDLPFFYANEK